MAKWLGLSGTVRVGSYIVNAGVGKFLVLMPTVFQEAKAYEITQVS